MRRILTLVAALLLAAPLLPGQSVIGGSMSFDIEGVTFKMIFVQGATYMMGGQPSELIEGDLDEQVRHPVKVNSFYILECPVTCDMWDVVEKGRVYDPDDPDMEPKTKLWYHEIVYWLEKLSGIRGKTFRLPTEAEWEFAARGGRLCEGFLYSGSSRLDSVGWYAGNSGDSLHPVKQLKPNELGIYDMSGLVWEYCSDWYNMYPEPSGVLDNPTGPSTGIVRVIRGGSYSCSPAECRVFKRFAADPEDYDYAIGFRFVMEAQ